MNNSNIADHRDILSSKIMHFIKSIFTEEFHGKSIMILMCNNSVMSLPKCTQSVLELRPAFLLWYFSFSFQLPSEDDFLLLKLREESRYYIIYVRHIILMIHLFLSYFYTFTSNFLEWLHIINVFYEVELKYIYYV